MHCRVLAVDYDGTIAAHGHADEETIRALRRVRESGRKLVLVTGRIVEDLVRVCPCVDVFDAPGRDAADPDVRMLSDQDLERAVEEGKERV